MIIDCISDLQGYRPYLHGGDLLIITGQLTALANEKEYTRFCRWVQPLDYRKKVIVPSYRDGFLDRNPHFFSEREEVYLCDSATEFEGLKIWGAPWIPSYDDICFNTEVFSAIQQRWKLIPKDTDILVTHIAPYGILDESIIGSNLGCKQLLKSLNDLNLTLHVFGHIAASSYKITAKGGTIFVNASYLDVAGYPNKKVVRIPL